MYVIFLYTHRDTFLILAYIIREHIWFDRNVNNQTLKIHKKKNICQLKKVKC